MNELDTLAAHWLEAKADEERARAARIDIETAMLALVDAKPEGAVTAHGTAYKATVTYGVNRTVDAAALDAIRAQIPVALFEQAVTYKPALVLPGLRYLQNNEPATYALLAQAVTAKPSKPAVKVESIEQAAKAA